ncbi:hypothetical protein MLGJGCBP_06185 [Rhodococcus sp. T7]|nr:hypothetical protein MLGJGCBP_06185 [Rhodococcus sp. T7]
MQQLDLRELDLTAELGDPFRAPAVPQRQRAHPLGAQFRARLGLPHGPGGGHDHPSSLLEHRLGGRARAVGLVPGGPQKCREQRLHPGSACRDRVDLRVGEARRVPGEQGPVTFTHARPVPVDIGFGEREDHGARRSRDDVEDGQLLPSEWRCRVEHHQDHPGVERILHECERGRVECAEPAHESGLACAPRPRDEDTSLRGSPGLQAGDGVRVPSRHDVDGLCGQIGQLWRRHVPGLPLSCRPTRT